MIFEKQVVNMYKGMMYTRCDDRETVFYFSANDFPGLRSESYPFASLEGHTLQGYVYYYENPIQNRLVVFDHGFGGGHRAYMKEIEKLCKYGFTVFSYDHTGCMESGGETPGGLAHSLCDLNDCIKALKSDERFKGFDISVIGHSWGAFSTLNITALHPEISHIVAISGFVSVEEMIKTFFSGMLKGYRKAVMKLERESNPEFVEFNAVETLSKSQTKALLIYSEDDTMCRKVHYDILRSGLEGKDNISFMLCKNKGHNPNYTEDAVKLLGSFVKARAKIIKNKKATKKEREQFVSSFDWNAMTVQDENVWNGIFKHLEK
ncbi:MAG: alpha/beta hydrolase [Ruminococcaceae bacterium]|nr:alpha/beta hydrolase [Oscillospiraceae bacterium]